MSYPQKYDSIVVGAGHAGIEASLAVARAGFKVLFLTMNTGSIGQMSCNPAIGGLAKGHIVREIDALGGEMAIATDATGIQFRMLNCSKGPAVWAPRAQCDKLEYQAYMKKTIQLEANIDLKQDHATKLLVENKRVIGVLTQSGVEYFSKTVVITTGTFMQGLIHVGDINFPGGRGGDPPSLGLSNSLRENGIETIRFKTGTPPRLRKSTIDFSVCGEQKGDPNPSPFSFRTEKITQEQLSCFLTYTNTKTHEIIKNNLHRSPLYGGAIQGVGPRYCPSIEDKVVKFADKERHQIYLEPESLRTEEIYVNGISTSLPQDVQIEFVHSIPGLEKAELLRFGYAIEYDCAPPTQLKHSLETKAVQNLFLAGQINCTSGYEEAAAQGLMAGLNVIRKLKDESPFILERSESYIGVLIDDLVTRGTSEPYRMFTSRAEFRLLLRQDNADERLMKHGYEFGLIPENIFQKMQKKIKKIEDSIQRLGKIRMEETTAEQWLKRPNNRCNSFIINELKIDSKEHEVINRIENDIKYYGYVQQQIMEVKKFSKMEKRKIPDILDYLDLNGISHEAREKLLKVRPVSIGQASRIPGISPADISILSVYVEKIAKITD